MYVLVDMSPAYWLLKQELTEHMPCTIGKDVEEEVLSIFQNFCRLLLSTDFQFSNVVDYMERQLVDIAFFRGHIRDLCDILSAMVLNLISYAIGDDAVWQREIKIYRFHINNAVILELTPCAP